MSRSSYSHFSQVTARKTPGVTVGAIALPLLAKGAIALPHIFPGHAAIALPVTQAAVPYVAEMCPRNNHDDIGDVPEPNRTRFCNDYLHSTDADLLFHDATELATLGYVTAAHRMNVRAHAVRNVSVVSVSRAPYYNPRTNRYG